MHKTVPVVLSLSPTSMTLSNTTVSPGLALHHVSIRPLYHVSPFASRSGERSEQFVSSGNGAEWTHGALVVTGEVQMQKVLLQCRRRSPTLRPTMFSVTMLSSTVTLYCFPPISATANTVAGAGPRPSSAAGAISARRCSPPAALAHSLPAAIGTLTPSPARHGKRGTGAERLKAVAPAAAAQDGATRDVTARTAGRTAAPAPRTIGGTSPHHAQWAAMVTLRNVFSRT